MITIIKSKDGISAIGHANYAPIGQDIVCSAFSSLIQTLIYSIKELTDDIITYNISSGNVSIKFRNQSGATKLLVDSFLIGVKSIVEAYPQYILLISAE